MSKPARLYPKKDNIRHSYRMVWNNNLKLWNIIKGERMVKAELIENPTESEIVKVDTIPDVDVAIEQWDAYQRLCKGLLNDNDYQEIIVKEKDENGNYVKVKRHLMSIPK